MDAGYSPDPEVSVFRFIKTDGRVNVIAQDDLAFLLFAFQETFYRFVQQQCAELKVLLNPFANRFFKVSFWRHLISFISAPYIPAKERLRFPCSSTLQHVVALAV